MEGKHKGKSYAECQKIIINEKRIAEEDGDSIRGDEYTIL
jgi:hypothetical protein